MKNILSILTITVSLSACATAPDKIAAASVSTIQYQDYSCKQIGMELDRTSRRLNELYHSLKTTASNDSAQMAAGLILFWPTLFFLEGGDGPQAQEYARLKGEFDALERVAIQKECGIDIPKQIVPEVKEQNYTRS